MFQMTAQIYHVFVKTVTMCMVSNYGQNRIRGRGLCEPIRTTAIEL